MYLNMLCTGVGTKLYWVVETKFLHNSAVESLAVTFRLHCHLTYPRRRTWQREQLGEGNC